MTEPLALLSFGAGAIGAYIGGSLALHGSRTVFLERPALAETLRVTGLRLRLADGQERLIPAPQIASDLGEALALGPFDAALFALKSFDTAAALEQLAGYRDRLPPIVCLQNGVENEAALERLLGPGRVIPATVTSAIGRRGAGEIVVERLRGVGIGGGHPLAERLAQAMTAAGLNARLYPRPADMKWSKLLTNLLANAASAILNMTPAQVFDHPGLYRLELDQVREALAVMDAQGIRPVDLPRTPVRLLAFGVRYLPDAVTRPVLQRSISGGRGAKMPSFHIDLHTGRGKSEVDALNGAVVRAGERLGTPTPANRLLTETLLALTEGRLALETYAGRPQALLDAYAQLKSAG
jgi:2-dehydropantoate 2-reductase